MDFFDDGGSSFLSYSIFSDCTRRNDASGGYAWRESAENGDEYSLYPDDFETEADYMQALMQAKEQYAWREKYEDAALDYGLDTQYCDSEDEFLSELRQAWQDRYDPYMEYPGAAPCDCSTEEEYLLSLKLEKLSQPDSQDNGEYSLTEDTTEQEEIRREDYPNIRQYNAATELDSIVYCFGADYECSEKKICKFILENTGSITAADYLTYDTGFIYAKAILDHFSLPCSLPDEDAESEMCLHSILCKISKRDMNLTLRIWDWVLETFLPYSEFAQDSAEDMTSMVIDACPDFPDGFLPDLAKYMNSHESFRHTLITSFPYTPEYTARLITAALKEKLYSTADYVFNAVLDLIRNSWKEINSLTVNLIEECSNYEEVETMEYFRDRYYTEIKKIPLGMVQDETEEWDKAIDEYIDYGERSFEKYRYTRRNIWRTSVPDGSQYGLDPADYDSEEEYMTDLDSMKYGWRDRYAYEDTYGLIPENFETEDDFITSLREKQEIVLKKKLEAHIREKEYRLNHIRKEEAEKRKQELLNDRTEYTYCGVMFSFSSEIYSYLAEDITVNIGDSVRVPLGDSEMTGTVVFTGRYMRVSAPYPPEKTKSILKKL